MTTSTTLLTRIANFTGRREDVAVEALGHILSYSEAARHELEEMLRAGGAEIGSIYEVHTQVRDEDGATPDLAGYDQHGAERLLIEAKFWAGLTEKQPNSYLTRLLKVKEGTKALLFLVPAARLRTLWPEVRQLAAENYHLSPDTELENLRSAAILSKDCHLIMTSWRALLASITTRVDIDRDHRAQLDIVQLRGLTEQMDGDEFVPFSPGELGPGIARRIRDVCRLVDRAVDKGIYVGLFADRGRASNWDYSYGRNMWFAEAANAWFGMYSRTWATRRETPLWLQIWGQGDLGAGEVRRRLEPLKQNEPSEGVSDDGYIPIDLPTGLDFEATADAVIERLSKIAALINPDTFPLDGG